MYQILIYRLLLSDSVADTIKTLEEEEEEEMVPLPPSAAPQPLIPILAIVMMILALSIVIMPLALLITIPLVFRRSSSSSVRIPKISTLIWVESEKVHYRSQLLPELQVSLLSGWWPDKTSIFVLISAHSNEIGLKIFLSCCKLLTESSCIILLQQFQIQKSRKSWLHNET